MSKLKAVLAAYECYFDDNRERYEQAKELVDKYQWLYNIVGHTLMMHWDCYRLAWIEVDTGMGYYIRKYENVNRFVKRHELTDGNIRPFFDAQLKTSNFTWDSGPDMYESSEIPSCGICWYDMHWIFDEMSCLEKGQPLKGIHFMKERAKH